MGSQVGDLGRAIRDALNSADPSNFSPPYDTWQSDQPAFWEWSPQIHAKYLNDMARVCVSPHYAELEVYEELQDDRCIQFVPTIGIVVGVAKALQEVVDPEGDQRFDVAPDAEIDALKLLSEEMIKVIAATRIPGYGLPLPNIEPVPALDESWIIQRKFSSWYAFKYTQET